jgi:hypothetical protein
VWWCHLFHAIFLSTLFLCVEVVVVVVVVVV